MSGDGEDTVISADETVISADDTVIAADDTVISSDNMVMSADDTVIEPDLDDTALAPAEAASLESARVETTTRPTASFELRLVTGARFRLTSAVVFGRAPRVTRQRTEDVVQLVSVPSREGRVSATHVEVRQVGDVVVVTDLHSTNGTRITSSNGVLRQLAPGDSMAVGEGAVVDIGDGYRIDIMREKPRDASNDIAR